MFLKVEYQTTINLLLFILTSFTSITATIDWDCVVNMKKSKTQQIL